MAKKEGRNSLSALKNQNRNQALDYIRQQESVSMAEIARVSGLSIMTVHNIVEHYLKAGMIKPAAVPPGDGKKNRARRFSFNPDYRCIFTARVAERKITAALTNLSGEITVSHSEMLRTNTPLPNTLEMLGEIFASLLKRRRVDADACLGAVVGWPGIIDRSGEVCVVAPHFPSWGRDIPLVKRLREIFPSGMIVHNDNSVRYHAYGEIKSKGPKYRRFFIITTDYQNVVGGLVIDGKVDRGSSGLSGEIGHMPVDPADREVCVCGSTGCLEVTASPKRLEELALAQRKKWRDSKLRFIGDDKRIPFAAIVEAANDGDAFACQLMDSAARLYATAIKNIILTCDPGFVIIQGAYAKAGEYFLSRLQRKIDAMPLFSMEKETRIEYSLLDDDCILTGAACFLADRYFAAGEGP